MILLFPAELPTDGASQRKSRSPIKHKGHEPPRLNADAVAVAVDQIEIVCLPESPHGRHPICHDGRWTRAQEPSADRAASRLFPESPKSGRACALPSPAAIVLHLYFLIPRRLMTSR